jgi:hypothetical protein
MDQEKLLSRYGRIRLPAILLKHGKVSSELRIVPSRNSQLAFTYHGHPRDFPSKTAIKQRFRLRILISSPVIYFRRIAAPETTSREPGKPISKGSPENRRVA